MATTDFTPQPAHTSPPTSITPTRHASYQSHDQELQHQHVQHYPHQHITSHGHHSSFHPNHSIPYQPAMTDFTSPSQFINHDAYTDSPTMTGYESAPNSASSSLSIPFSATLPEHEFYPDFNDYLPPGSSPTVQADDDVSRMEDDRTPVISDQAGIPPKSFPALPRGDGQGSSRVKSEHEQQSLLSPFRPMAGQPIAIHPATVNIAAATGQLPSQPYSAHGNPSMYYMPPGMAMPHGAVMYPGAPVGMIPAYPQQPHMMQYPQSTTIGGVMYGQPGAWYPAPPPHVAPQAYDFGPARSRHGSPTSSVSSSARPKVKLSWDDKRNIVELHRSNSSLRQEDIAKQYGVDRSTISKIILSSHRWIQPQEAPVAPVPKVPKTVGGRFPAVEQLLDPWFDEQISLGVEIRDSVARDKAKEFAKQVGYPLDRFKASAKWLDKFKERRRAAGRPVSGTGGTPYAYYPYPMATYADSSRMGSSIMLSRSQSAVTLSSSDSSSQDMYQASPGGQHSMIVPTPHVVTPHQMPLTRSETDLIHMDLTPSSRQRSQSSPQVLGEPGMLSPSSGKASRFVRPTPLSLQRQNSYHGSSPSPRRPVPLIRSTTSQGGSLRRSRPTSLAASAFGITPIIGEDQQFAGSPINSPTSASTSGTHSRQPSEASLAPFTSSLSGMTISPTISDNGEMLMMGVPPLTPITPAHGHSSGAFPNNDYSAAEGIDEFGGRMTAGSGPGRSAGGYSTMPNKHYVGQQYVAQPANYSHGYGQAQAIAQPATATAPGWQ